MWYCPGQGLISFPCLLQHIIIPATPSIHTWIMPTSLAPSPMPNVMALSLAWTSLVTLAYEGDSHVGL